MRTPLNKHDHIMCSYGDATVITDDGTYVICKLANGKIVTTPSVSCGHVPSPKDIEAATEVIQGNWTNMQKWQRTSPADRPWPVELPGNHATYPVYHVELEAYLQELERTDDE